MHCSQLLLPLFLFLQYVAVVEFKVFILDKVIILLKIAAAVVQFEILKLIFQRLQRRKIANTG